MATGVLPIAVNRATKFIPVMLTEYYIYINRGILQYLDKEKSYEGAIRFGLTTDSDDITGWVLKNFIFGYTRAYNKLF
jgi:tRNA U55 pseudouridine synthase TruB